LASRFGIICGNIMERKRSRAAGLPAKTAVFAIAAAFSSLCAAAEPDIDIAREALRDGLWSVARARAEKAGGDAAKNVILESYAREGRWQDVLKCLDGWGNPDGESFRYWRALALSETGRPGEAADSLAATEFKLPGFEEPVALLKMKIAMAAGDLPAALKIAADPVVAGGSPSAKALAAEAFAASGAKDRAAALWRDVLAATNVDVAAGVAAAAGLGDVAALRMAADLAKGTPHTRAAGLNLARRLLADAATYEEGAAMVRPIVKDSPGAPGAKDAFLALADAALARKKYEDAAAFFREATEAWPETSREAAVQEGLGWALRRLGRTDEAVEAFARSGECAKDDAAKAAALLAQGDTLAEAGRGDASLEKYRIVLDKYPSTPSGARLKTMLELREAEARGRRLYASFRFAEAANVFSGLAARDPSRKPRMDYLEMLCLYGQGRDAEASRKAKDLAAGSPDPAIKAEATLWLAKFFYNAKSWDDSRDMFAEYATNMAPKSAWAPSAMLWAARAAFAGNGFRLAVDLSTRLARDWPDSPERISGCLVQGEALVELSRLDEAVVVLEKVVSDAKAAAGDRMRARILKADALFFMGADNSARYREALGDYRAILMGEEPDPDTKLSLAFKIARTLERQGRTDEAMEQYYGEVVCAYRAGRVAGTRYGDEAKATFARAAFRLADEYEDRGERAQADAVLKLVAKSDVGAASVKEAKRRRERLRGKGLFK